VKDKQIQGFYEFASFRLDIKKRRLTRDGEVVPLTPKEFDVLFFLVENAGRIVEKDELLRTV
jgi:DNA-binding winged helix-turn-helix (wHTH) protein